MAEATDAELVAAIRGGDPAAWGEVFDRHRDAVWRVAVAVTRNTADAEDVLSSSFLRAVESVHQLEQPERLRPWLLSIARRGALDRVRPSRRREQPSDVLDDLTPVGDDEGDDLSLGISADERVRLVHDALDGLDERDRLALELSAYDDLSGEELAEALDVTRDNAYALVHNARERFALSVSSLLVARRGRGQCADLDELLGRWDGRLNPLIRKRVARHVRGCEVCEATRGRSVSPSALLAGVPILVAPAALVDRARADTVTAANASATTPLPASTGLFTGSAGAKVAAALVAATLVGGAAVGLVSVSRSDASPAAAESTSPRTTAVPSSSSVAPGPTVITTAAPTAAPSTSEASAPVESNDPCDLVGELMTFASAGPGSPAGDAVVQYLAGTRNRLDAVVASLGDETTSEMLAYADAYARLVDTGVSNLAEIPDGPELRALADIVESQLAERC